MKILFLNEYAPPHIVSGAERSMIALSKALSNLSKQTKIYTLSPNLNSTGPVPKDKFPFPKKLKPGQTLSPLWFNNPIFWFYAAYHVVKAVKKHHINLIHVHGKYIQPTAIIASWFTKIPVVTTVRDFKFLCPLSLCYTHQQKNCSLNYYLRNEIPFYLNNYTNNKLAWPFLYLRLILSKPWQYILKWFLKQASQVIAISPQLKQIYLDSGIKNTISFYNLPPKKFPPIKPKYKIKGKQIIVSVGKLSIGKGTDTLLKAMKLLEAKLPQAILLIAGNKNISLKTNFPPNSKYLGKLDHHHVFNLYRSADIFVILSRWPEPLSRAALEALTAGLPIVASNRGGNKEFVKNNGYLVNPDDPKQVADTLYKILTNKKLENFSQNSLKLIATRFNRKKTIDQHINLYKRLI
jgi:glycosyltransferase involved in cell wall biosynthesis